MINIRKNVFETNSSSVHAICISKDKELEIPKELTFCFDDYGWQDNLLNTPIQLASYLYTAIYNLYFDNKDELNDFKNYIYDTLGKHGCDCTFDEPKNERYGIDYGYIDHLGELVPLIESLRKSEKKLLRFLFSPDSFIVTGNDNSDTFYDWLDEFEDSKEKKKVDIYVKGN